MTRKYAHAIGLGLVLLCACGPRATLRLHADEADDALAPVTALAFAPDGRSLVVGSQGELRVVSWPELREVRRIAASMPHVHDLAFSPAGDRLAVAGGTPGEQGAVEILSWPDAERLQLVTEHTDVAWSVAWRGDSQAWASASADRTLRIHAEDGRCLQTLAGHSRGATGVAWLPNNRTLVSTSLDQSVRVWNADQPAAIRTLENHTRGVLALAMMPGATTNDAARIATVGDDRTVRIWQPSIGRMVRFTRLESPPKALAWTPDGGKVVAACADGRVRTIDANLAQVVADVAAVEGWAYSVAIAPNGESVAVGGERGQVVQVTTNGLR